MAIIKRLSYAERVALQLLRAKVEAAMAEYNRLVVECGLNPADTTSEINWETGEVDDMQPVPVTMNRATRRRQSKEEDDVFPDLDTPTESPARA